MKPSEEHLTEARRQHTEAIINRHIEQLFQRVPMLSGFWLRPDLDVAELSVFTWPGFNVEQHVYDEVMNSLVDLLEDRPEAVPLMCGRTFARAVQ